VSAVHIHLLLNHVPVLGSIGCLLFLAVGLARRSREVTAIALFATVVTALLTIPVFLTGEPAEDTAEKLPGVMKEFIHEHEEAAEVAFTAMEVAGGLALLTLIVGLKRDTPRWATVLTLVVLLVAAGLIARAAALGGEIRHTEIRSGAVAPAAGEHDD
jgi:hypothetical protein